MTFWRRGKADWNERPIYLRKEPTCSPPFKVRKERAEEFLSASRLKMTFLYEQDPKRAGFSFCDCGEMGAGRPLGRRIRRGNKEVDEREGPSLNYKDFLPCVKQGKYY